MIKLDLTVNEVNMILGALAALTQKIQDQANSQLPQPVPTPAAVECSGLILKPVAAAT